VRIFGLLGRSAENDACRTLCTLHAEFLAAYRAQRWEEARRLAGQARGQNQQFADP
jgi:hypothetical protein